MVNHSAASYGSESGRVMIGYGSGARPRAVCHFALGVGDERSCVTVGAPRSAQPADGFAAVVREPDIARGSRYCLLDSCTRVVSRPVHESIRLLIDSAAVGRERYKTVRRHGARM